MEYSWRSGKPLVRVVLWYHREPRQCMRLWLVFKTCHAASMTINADGSLAALADSVTQWFQGTEKPRFTLARDSDKLELGKGIEPPIANLYILFYSRLLPAAGPSFVTGQPWIRNWDYELLINGSTENVLPAMGVGGIVLRCGPRLTQACWKHKRLSEERTTGFVSSQHTLQCNM